MKEIVNDGFAKVVKPYIDAQDKKSREIIAPVEVSPAEAPHSVGDQIIYNGLLYDVIAPIAVEDPLATSGAGANISLADNIEAQIKATKSQIQAAAAQAAAQNKKNQKMLAPVEEDETDASRAYVIGEQLILDGILYNVIDPIAQHGIITAEGAGANIEEADDVTTQLSSLKQTLTNKTDMLMDNGAVNMMPISATSQTVKGITFTVNSDGTVTANGTATENAAIEIVADSVVNALRAAYGGTVRLTGCPANGGSSSYNIYVHYPSPSEYPFDGGDGLVLTKDIDQPIRMQVMNGQTVNNLVFKPMLSDPILNLSYDDYVPYAKTNRELTEIAEILADKGFLNVPNGGNAPNINPDNHKTVGLWRYNINNVDYYGFSFIFNKDWVCQIRTQTRGTYLQYRIFNNTSWSEWKYLGDCTHRIYRGATSGSETAKSKTFTVMDGYIYHVYGYYSTNYTHKMFTYHGSVVREFDLEQSGTVDCCSVSIDGQNVTVSSAAQRYAQIQVFETQGAWTGESD